MCYQNRDIGDIDFFGGEKSIMAYCFIDCIILVVGGISVNIIRPVCQIRHQRDADGE